MPDINHQAIEQQIAQWTEALDHILEENIALKHRLSGIIIRERHSAAGLETLEAFQNSFLNKDAHIALLQQDIKIQRLLAKTLLNGRINDTGFRYQQQKLQFDVMMMEQQFRRLKAAFEKGVAAGDMA